jgi:hypothetical protein
MATQNGLTRRVEALEATLPATACRTCGERPVFAIGGSAEPCDACGRSPRRFTIDIERASGREDDAA